jgi:hypothetical protein
MNQQCLICEAALTLFEGGCSYCFKRLVGLQNDIKVTYVDHAKVRGVFQLLTLSRARIIERRWKTNGISVSSTKGVIMIEGNLSTFRKTGLSAALSNTDLTRTPLGRKLVSNILFLVLASSTYSQQVLRLFIFHRTTLRHTPQSVRLLWTRDRPVAETST